jgi:hypothetical protein
MQPLDDDLRDIVDAYARARAPSDATRDAIWAAIERSLDAEAIAGEASRGAWTGRAAVIGVVAALAAGILLGVGLAPRESADAGANVPGSAAYSRVAAPETSDVLVAPASHARSGEREAIEAPSPEPAAAETMAVPDPVEPARQHVPRSPRGAGPSALRREMDLVRDARTALTEGRPRRALALVSAHRRKFPHGLLREEARALEVAALCEVGPRTRWRAALSRFDADHPGSPLRAKLRDTCTP